jgi:glycosyltransferase involved in cell wall biosynthesis
MKKILIVNPGHYGSFVDTLYHVKYLKSKFHIEYFGINEEQGSNFDIKVILLDKKSNGMLSKIYFLFMLNKFLRKNNYDILFINYFVGCSLINFFRGSFIKVLDIRSSIISSKFLYRYFFNWLLKVESLFFSNITVISQGVREYLNLDKSAHILPLGGPIYKYAPRDQESLNLIYVGTFNSRNLHHTILGFHKFYLKYGDKIQMKYRIIGSGNNFENQFIMNLISDLNNDSIEFLGFVNHSEIGSYFNLSNLGVSYIPITDYFNYQPPTKTFEYLLSGMPVIATQTVENCKVINEMNGILIEDSSESFYNALVKFYYKRNDFDYFKIYKDSQRYSWENIVTNNLSYYFENR